MMMEQEKSKFKNPKNYHNLSSDIDYLTHVTCRVNLSANIFFTEGKKEKKKKKKIFFIFFNQGKKK